MKRFVEGVDRGQSSLFPVSLDDYVTEQNRCERSTCSSTVWISIDSGSPASSRSKPADPAIPPGRCSSFTFTAILIGFHRAIQLQQCTRNGLFYNVIGVDRMNGWPCAAFDTPVAI